VCKRAVTSVHRSSLFPFVLGFALLTTMTWLCHVLGPRVIVRAVSASRHLRFGTCYHLISRTLMLVVNSSSRALRLGSLCKPTHKRRHWELCLSGALQMLVDWLIDCMTALQHVVYSIYTHIYTVRHNPFFEGVNKVTKCCSTDMLCIVYSLFSSAVL